MARRIAQPLYTLYGDDVISANINITSETISLRIVANGEQPGNIDLLNPDIIPEPIPYETIISDFTLSIETVKQINNLKSNMLLGIAVPNSFRGDQLTTKNIINLSNLTKDNRVEQSNSVKVPKMMADIHLNIFIKDINGTFDDHDIILYLPKQISQENITSNVVLEKPTLFSHTELLDNITISENNSYINNDYYKFNVTTESYVDEVFLEEVFGIIDRKRVSLTNGSGSFRVLKSSLESGETLKVKAGFYSYPGITSVSKQV